MCQPGGFLCPDERAVALPTGVIVCFEKIPTAGPAL